MKFTQAMPLPSLFASVFGTASDELAYLALTSNSELALRDRVALYLHQHPDVDAHGWLVSRELSPDKVDLAILDREEQPLALFEFTARYTYDALQPGKWRELQQKLQNDIDKCARLAARYQTVHESYAILFIAHPCSPIPTHRTRIAGKYAGGIRSTFEGCSDADGLDRLREAGERIVSTFRGVGVRSLDVGKTIGTAFETRVKTVWFAIGPLSSEGCSQEALAERGR